MTLNTEKGGNKKFLSIIIGFAVSLTIFIVIYILSLLQKGWVYENLIPREYVKYFVFILPGELWTDTILLYLFPLAIYGLFHIIAPYTTLFFLKLHRIFYRSKKRFHYGIVKLGHQVKPFMLFRRSVIVSLFAFSVSALIVQAGLGSLFRVGMMEDSALNEAEAIFLGTFIIIPIVLLIFLPLWLLEDSGIVICKLYADRRRPPLIEGTHAPFVNVLQGYAGISTVIILVTYIVRTLAESVGPSILTPIIMIVLPFFITGLISFAVYAYEKNIPKLIGKIQPHLTKLNIYEIEIPTFDEMKRN
ncbi:MAG: hypothetical protein ACFFCV_14695 [Promethearchaeota archaeon]